MPRSALIRNLMRSGYPSVITDKLLGRVSESADRIRTHTSANVWAQAEATDIAELATVLDADLSEESLRFAAAFEGVAAR